MTTTVEIQFRGYQPIRRELPLAESPFEYIDSAADATDILESALIGDEDDDGWIVWDAAGEEFQVRVVGE